MQLYRRIYESIIITIFNNSIEYILKFHKQQQQLLPPSSSFFSTPLSIPFRPTIIIIVINLQHLKRNYHRFLVYFNSSYSVLLLLCTYPRIFDSKLFNKFLRLLLPSTYLPPTKLCTNTTRRRLTVIKYSIIITKSALRSSSSL